MGKKVFLSVCLLMILCLCGCSKQNDGEEQAENKDTSSLYDHGMKVVATMQEKVQSEVYGKVIGNPKELEKVIATVKEGDYTKPKAVYEIEYDASMWPLIFAQDTQMPNLDKISETLKKALEDKAQLSIGNVINAESGTASLAASSVYSAESSFVSHEISKNTNYLYTFEKGAPVLVTYIVGEDHTVTASGMFLLLQNASCSSKKEVEDMFAEMVSMLPIEVKEITK